jgi:hypothetical protein
LGGGRALDRRQGANPSVDFVACGRHQPSWGGYGAFGATATARRPLLAALRLQRLRRHAFP